MPDTYSGIYMRKSLKQTAPYYSGSDLCQSPDVIPYGIAPVADPQTLFSGNYAQDVGKNIVKRGNNYIYLRGKNCAQTKLAQDYHLYYVPSSLILWPNRWANNQIPTGKIPPQYAVKLEGNPEKTCVGAIPFEWTPPDLDPNQHYCLVATDIPSNEIPTADLTWNMLLEWIRKPNVGWRNVILTDVNAPTWARQYDLSVPPDIQTGSKVYIYAELNNVPDDQVINVEVAISCPPNIVKKAPITSKYDIVGIGAELPADFKSKVTLTYWNNNNPLPAGVSVDLKINYYPDTTFDIHELNSSFPAAASHKDILTFSGAHKWYPVGGIQNLLKHV